MLSSSLVQFIKCVFSYFLHFNDLPFLKNKLVSVPYLAHLS